MRQVTEQDLLDISYDEFVGLGYFDQKLVERVWTEAGRIKALPDDIYDMYGNIEPFSEDGYAIFRGWLADQGATYYADPREEFFIYKGIEKCLKEGNKLLYVEDLS